MIKVNDNTVVIDLGANTREDKANVIGELAVAFKGVSKVTSIKPKRLLKMVKEGINALKDSTAGEENVKEN